VATVFTTVAFFWFVRYNASMKRQHAAALVLVGWYLMVPPNKNDDMTPISGWIVRHTYDSAEACQAAQRKERDEATAKLRQYDSMSDLQRRNLEHNQETLDQEMADKDGFDTAWHSACIESDDPRLKAK
jgi:hypothetical protein